MAEIRDCIGREIKIGKTSITIKGDNGKTCGIVKGISRLADVRPNKQVEYFRQLKQCGAWGRPHGGEYIVCDSVLYVFRDIRSKLWNDKHGYFSEEERQSAETREVIYTAIRTAGIEVIEHL